MTAEAAVGARVLAEVEETNLDEILSYLRTSLTTIPNITTGNAAATTDTTAAAATNSKLKVFPIPVLNSLVTRHFRATQSAPLAVCGRYLALVYLLIATLIAAPHKKAVVVIDTEGHFEVTKVLQCTPYTEPQQGPEQAAEPGGSAGDDSHSPTNLNLWGETPRVTAADLSHVHVYRPARGSGAHVADVVAAAEKHMLYGAHGSRAREWWGTLVVGGGGGPGVPVGGAAVVAGGKGWLRVDREEVRTFGFGTSAEEALEMRDQRQRIVDEGCWVASSVWGGFRFTSGG